MVLQLELGKRYIFVTQMTAVIYPERDHRKTVLHFQADQITGIIGVIVSRSVLRVKRRLTGSASVIDITVGTGKVEVVFFIGGNLFFGLVGVFVFQLVLFQIFSALLTKAAIEPVACTVTGIFKSPSLLIELIFIDSS